MFHSRICDMLNIKYPIFQGGMAWVATAKLAAAVSNAGGLGLIAAGNAPADVVEKEIYKARKLTDKPFGVNIMLLSPYVDEVMDLVCREKVDVVTTGAGNPGKYIARLKEQEIKIFPVVPSLALAKRMERLEVDGLIVEGTEAGGHIGELTTMVLVPNISSQVDIPVVAAGGISNGRGFLAALSLGAEGVQIGTRFVCSTECEVHENYKKKLISAKDRDAIVTGRSTGHPVRALKNKFTKEFLNLEKKGISKEELDRFGTGKLKLAVIDGDTDNGSVMAGQSVAMVNDIKPCEEIIKEIINDAEKRLLKLMDSK